MAKPRRTLVLILAAVTSTHCAGVSGERMTIATSPERGRAMLSAAEKIPAGSRVSLALADGRRFKAVLLAVEGGAVVVQQRTRLPEPPLRLDPAEVVSLELDLPRAVSGKMIAIGVGIGSGVTLAVLAFLAAALSD